MSVHRAPRASPIEVHPLVPVARILVFDTSKAYLFDQAFFSGNGVHIEYILPVSYRTFVDNTHPRLSFYHTPTTFAKQKNVFARTKPHAVLMNKCLFTLDELHELRATIDHPCAFLVWNDDATIVDSSETPITYFSNWWSLRNELAAIVSSLIQSATDTAATTTPSPCVLLELPVVYRNQLEDRRRRFAPIATRWIDAAPPVDASPSSTSTPTSSAATTSTIADCARLHDSVATWNAYAVALDKPLSVLARTPKERFRVFAFAHLPYIRHLALPDIPCAPLPAPQSLEAVLVEFRVLPHLEFVIRNCMLKLGPRWSHTIVCGRLNGDWMRALAQSIHPHIRVLVFEEVDNLTPNEYSPFLAQRALWEALQGDKLLLYQEDTCLFRTNIDDFLEWDYIGAPYRRRQNDTAHGVGNGGLSLRSRQVMLDVIDKVPYGATESHLTMYNSSTLQYMRNAQLLNPPEDIYFARSMEVHGLGRLATWDAAYRFSSESFLNPQSCGGHGVWVNGYMYLDTTMPDKWKEMMFTYVTPRICRVQNSPSDHRGGWEMVKTAMDRMIGQHAEYGIAFHDVCESYFLWNEQRTPLTKPWMGVIHCTPLYLTCPDAPAFYSIVDVARMVRDSCFRQSLRSCLGLISLSKPLTDYLRQELDRMPGCGGVGRHVPIATLRHPTDTNVPLFEWAAFQANPRKTLIQVGQQLRKMLSIYEVEVPAGFHRAWLTGMRSKERSREFLQREERHWHRLAQCAGIPVRPGGILQEEDWRHLDSVVTMTYFASFEDFDRAMAENIVFIDLYDSAANNTVVECIARNTPLVVNRTAGVVEYLGEAYPLYFDRLEEVPALLTDERLRAAHEYLRGLNKDYLSVDRFTRDLMQFVYRCNDKRVLPPVDVADHPHWNV